MTAHLPEPPECRGHAYGVIDLVLTAEPRQGSAYVVVLLFQPVDPVTPVAEQDPRSRGLGEPEKGFRVSLPNSNGIRQAGETFGGKVADRCQHRESVPAIAL